VRERGDLTRVFLWALVAFLSVTALLAIVIFLRGRFEETEVKILLTTVALAVYSLTALCGAALIDHARAGAFGYATIVVSALALVLALVSIWADEGESEGLVKTTFVFMALAGSSAWASLLISRRRNTDAAAVTWTLAGTTAAIAVLAVTVIGMILRDDPSEFSFRLLGVIAVLAVLGTLLLPIVRRIGGQARTE
jgi:hypothetical protein